MPIVAAKCPSCGAELEVNNELDAAICKYCNSAYIVEKAVSNYVEQKAAIINNYYGEKKIVNENSSSETVDYLVSKLERLYRDGNYMYTDKQQIDYLIEKIFSIDNKNVDALIIYYEFNEDYVLEKLRIIYETCNEEDKKKIEAFYLDGISDASKADLEKIQEFIPASLGQNERIISSVNKRNQEIENGYKASVIGLGIGVMIIVFFVVIMLFLSLIL